MAVPRFGVGNTVRKKIKLFMHHLQTVREPFACRKYYVNRKSVLRIQLGVLRTVLVLNTTHRCSSVREKAKNKREMVLLQVDRSPRYLGAFDQARGKRPKASEDPSHAHFGLFRRSISIRGVLSMNQFPPFLIYMGFQSKVHMLSLVGASSRKMARPAKVCENKQLMARLWPKTAWSKNGNNSQTGNEKPRITCLYG